MREDRERFASAKEDDPRTLRDAVSLEALAAFPTFCSGLILFCFEEGSRNMEYKLYCVRSDQEVIRGYRISTWLIIGTSRVSST